MRFTQIRYVPKTVSLKYEDRKSDTDSVTIERTVQEEPSPEFQAALAGFRRFLRQLTGIQDKKWLEKAIITGVHLKYSKEDRRGYMVTLTRAIDASNSPVNLTTPLIFEEDEAEDPVGEQIELLIAEAEAFLGGARAQLSLAVEGNGQQVRQDDLEAAIEAEQEATRRQRQREAFEIRSALAGALPELPDKDPWQDDELVDLIGDAWGVQELEHDGRSYDGFYRHETADHQVAWCYLRGLPNPGFFYGVPAPDEIPTYEGEELIKLARSLYWPKPDVEPETTSPAETQAEPTPTATFASSTRPKPEPGEATVVLLAGIHTLMFERDGAELAWSAMHEAGGTDAEIESMLRGAFLGRGKGDNRFGISEPVGMNGDGPVKFEVVEFTMDPLSAATGKGKKKQVLQGQLLLDAVRGMLDIPEPEPEPVGVAAGNADDLFGDD